ncbi:serine/threonine-protein kinase Sgk2 [Nemania serpens]|nr:serine/threonine-protein kinase Sgk2 [Nemania serpens]
MAPSQQAKDTISELPLKDTLDPIRHKLCDYDDANPPQEDIASLLSALVGSPTALSLSSPDGSGDVATKLFYIYKHVRQGLVKLDYFCGLVHHEAVFDIIDNLGALTPPPSSIAPTFQGTPLFFEIRDCTFRNVGGFCDKFFNTKSWDARQKEMLEAVMAEHDGNRWKLFPTVPAERLVWDWLRSLEDRALSGAPHKLHTTRTAHQFKERKGQMDLFFQTPAPEASGIFEYKHVLVVGEQKLSYDTGRFKADFLQLTRLVRGVFTDQPTRRFVHAFTLSASMMELWVFDRSGAYSSGAFDIHDKPDTFARALVGYATMDNDAIGLDTFIEREGKHHYVTVDDIDGNKTRIRLSRPIVRQKAIVCRGTTCYKTQDGHVAKFSWASDKRKLEVEQLRLAKTRGVKGVARVVAHRQITTIAELRERLEFRERHKFRNEDVFFEDLLSVGTIDMSSHKRKSSSDHRSNTSESKKPRSNSQQSTLVQKQNSKHLTSTDKPSLYNAGGDMWENRIYSCLVISPAGRVISDFRTMAGGFNGMLIDLDLAKIRDSGPSGARHQTGTMQFMAVEVLRKTDHTYRHDLESFFYVLLWMCARQSWRNGFARGEKPPKESILRRWEIGSFRDIARNKAGDMTVDGLEGIMTEFPSMLDFVQPLCLRIRKILFPLDKDERMSFGTPAGDPDQLYNPIIAAFDNAIRNI